jgi:hypothetical protein
VSKIASNTEGMENGGKREKYARMRVQYGMIYDPPGKEHAEHEYQRAEQAMQQVRQAQQQAEQERLAREEKHRALEQTRQRAEQLAALLRQWRQEPPT